MATSDMSKSCNLSIIWSRASGKSALPFSLPQRFNVARLRLRRDGCRFFVAGALHLHELIGCDEPRLLLLELDRTHFAHVIIREPDVEHKFVCSSLNFQSQEIVAAFAAEEGGSIVYEASDVQVTYGKWHVEERAAAEWTTDALQRLVRVVSLPCHALEWLSGEDKVFSSFFLLIQHRRAA